MQRENTFSHPFLTQNAFKEFIDLNAGEMNLTGLYPNEHLIAEYIKVTSIKPEENETEEARLVREQKEIELGIKQQLFKNQFEKLMEKYHQYGIKNGATQSALVGINRLRQEFFSEILTGTQSSEFFSSTKRDLEELYFLFNNEKISLDKRKQVFEELCEGFKVCGPGIGEHIQYAKLILSNATTVTGWLAKKRSHIIHGISAKYEREYKNELKIHPGNRVHIDGAFRKRAYKNRWAPFGIVDDIKDDFFGTVGLDDHHEDEKKRTDAVRRLNKFDKDFIADYTSKCILQTIYEGFLELCEEKAPEAFHQRWLIYDKDHKAQDMVDTLEKLLKAAELEDLPADFFETKEDGMAIKFNSDLFKMRLLKWCHDKNIFQDGFWQKQTLDKEYTFVISENNIQQSWIHSKDEFLHFKNSTISHAAWQLHFKSLAPKEQMAFLEAIGTENLNQFVKTISDLNVILVCLHDDNQAHLAIELCLRNRNKNEFFQTDDGLKELLANPRFFKNKDVIKLIRSYGNIIEALLFRSGKLEQLEQIALEEKLDLSSLKDNNGKTLLDIAREINKPPLMKWLISKKVDYEIEQFPVTTQADLDGLSFALMAIVDSSTAISYPQKFESLVIKLKELVDKKNPESEIILNVIKRKIIEIIKPENNNKHILQMNTPRIALSNSPVGFFPRPVEFKLPGVGKLVKIDWMSNDHLAIRLPDGMILTAFNLDGNNYLSLIDPYTNKCIKNIPYKLEKAFSPRAISFLNNGNIAVASYKFGDFKNTICVYSKNGKLIDKFKLKNIKLKNIITMPDGNFAIQYQTNNEYSWEIGIFSSKIGKFIQTIACDSLSKMFLLPQGKICSITDSDFGKVISVQLMDSSSGVLVPKFSIERDNCNFPRYVAMALKNGNIAIFIDDYRSHIKDKSSTTINIYSQDGQHLITFSPPTGRYNRFVSLLDEYFAIQNDSCIYIYESNGKCLTTIDIFPDFSEVGMQFFCEQRLLKFLDKKNDSKETKNNLSFFTNDTPLLDSAKSINELINCNNVKFLIKKDVLQANYILKKANWNFNLATDAPDEFQKLKTHINLILTIYSSSETQELIRREVISAKSLLSIFAGVGDKRIAGKIHDYFMTMNYRDKNPKFEYDSDSDDEYFRFKN